MKWDYQTKEGRMGIVEKPYNFAQALTIFAVAGAMATFVLYNIFIV